MPQSPSSSAASAASVQVRPRPCSKRPGQAATTSARKRAKDRANVPNTHGSSDFDAVSVSSATGRPKRNIHPALSDASISGILGEDQDDLDSLTREVEFDEVIMALNLREELTMGCAYYHTQEGILYLAQEVTAATTDIAEQFIIHVQPTTIILSGRAPEELINFLEKKSQDTIGRGMSDLDGCCWTACDCRMYRRHDPPNTEGCVFITIRLLVGPVRAHKHLRQGSWEFKWPFGNIRHGLERRSLRRSTVLRSY